MFPKTKDHIRAEKNGGRAIEMPADGMSGCRDNADLGMS